MQIVSRHPRIVEEVAREYRFASRHFPLLSFLLSRSYSFSSRNETVVARRCVSSHIVSCLLHVFCVARFTLDYVAPPLLLLKVGVIPLLTQRARVRRDARLDPNAMEPCSQCLEFWPSSFLRKPFEGDLESPGLYRSRGEYRSRTHNHSFLSSSFELRPC